MDVVAQIKAAVQKGLHDEDGHPLEIEVSPPMDGQDRQLLEERLGVRLPRELHTFLDFTSGIQFIQAKKSRAFTILDGVTVWSEDAGFFPEFFTHGLPISHDGAGNYWVLDITPSTTESAPIFYASHDPPVVLYQSPDLATFVAEVFRLFTPPYTSLVSEVFEDSLFEVWRKNPGIMSHTEAASSPDPRIRQFAAVLPEYLHVVDLRNAPPGMGMCHGGMDITSELRRHGEERIFAFGKPPRPGMMARLFGAR